MSIENRLAAKKRAQEARKKATLRKWGVAIVLIAIAVIVGVVFGIRAIVKYNKNHVNFDKYVTEDGLIRDCVAAECVKNIPDLNTIPVDHAAVPTEEEILSTEAQLAKYLLAQAGVEVAEDATDADVIAKMTDDFVAQNAGTLFPEKYEKTEAGLKAYVTDYLTDECEEEIQNDVYSFVANRVTFDKLPKKYIRFLAKKGIRFLTKQDYLSRGYTEADIDEAIVETYGSETAFREYLDAEAESEVKSTLTWLAIYDQLGLNVTMDDFKKAKREEDYATLSDAEFEKTWNDIVKAYQISYLFMQYKCKVDLEELAKKSVANSAQ